MRLTIRRLSDHRTTRRYNYKCIPVWAEGWIRKGWHEDGSTYVEIDSLLDQPYTFGLAIKSDPGELESWLERYASEKPREAIPMLLKMLVLAVKKAGLGGVPE